MQRSGTCLLAVAALVMVALLPAEANAQAELTPFVGYLLGSNIDPDVDNSPPPGGRSFENSFTWGVRGAYFFEDAPNIGLEGSFTQSPFANFVVGPTTLDARATYIDMNLVVQSTGRAQFYGTAGLGMTRFRMGASEGGQTHTKLGINYGVGVKAALWQHAGGGNWGVRFDVRDQWLRMEADSSIRSNFQAALRLDTNSVSSIHNVVTSIGAYFIF